MIHYAAYITYKVQVTYICAGTYKLYAYASMLLSVKRLESVSEKRTQHVHNSAILRIPTPNTSKQA